MRRQPLPHGLDQAAFRVSDARDAGVTDGRLFALDLRRPHYGLRSPAPVPLTLVARCLELLPALSAGHCFSHATAAQLWGLPVPLDALADPTLHVTSTAGLREPRRRGVRGHRSTDVLVVEHLGLPIVSPLRAWAQCAETFSVPDLVIMGDALVSKWSPYGPARYRTLQQLETLVTRWAGRRGAARLAEALSLIRLHAWSPKESELRLFVRDSGCLEPPELNSRMYAADGSYLGRPDMAYPLDKIAIEYEGDHHRVSVTTYRNDITRRERFADEGWRTLRVTEADLAEATALRRRCRALLPRA